MVVEYNEEGKKINELGKQCECVVKKRTQRLITSSKITPEFREKRLNNFDKEGIHDDVRNAFNKTLSYITSFPNIRRSRNNSICLLGQAGCGKTHLLMAVANHLINSGIEVHYFPWTEGFSELKSDFNLLDERIRRLQTVDVLFIDDMFKGREKPTEFQVEQSFSIFNFRYLNNLPVLISSERSIAQMCEYDEALGSRINEMCKGHKAVIELDMDKNYRLRD